MIFIPCAFFLVYFLKQFKKKGFDVGAYMALLFLITSTFAIYLRFVDYQWDINMDDMSRIHLGVYPTLVYCLLIGLCIIPYARINTNEIRTFMPFKGVKVLDYIVWMSFFSMIFLLIIYMGDVLSALLSGNMYDVRNTEKTSTPITRLTGTLRYVGAVANKISNASYLLLPYYFYSKCFLRKSRLYNAAILLSTTPPIFMSIIMADRSVTTFYLMQFLLAFLIFKPYMNLRVKKNVYKTLVIFVGILLVYLVFTTISRFSRIEGGVGFNLFRYIGQPYLNFCLVWDGMNDMPTFYDRVFPITSTILGLNRGAELMEYVRLVNETRGVHINVFFSFIGMFIVDVGRVAAILIPIVLFLLSLLGTNPLRRGGTINLFNVYCIYILGIINVCGIITYYYSSIERALPAYIYLILMYFFCRKKTKAI